MTTFLEAMTAHRYAEKVCAAKECCFCKKVTQSSEPCCCEGASEPVVVVCDMEQRAAALDAAEKLEAFSRRLPLIVDSICAGMITPAETEVCRWCHTEAQAWRALIAPYDADLMRDTTEGRR